MPLLQGRGGMPSDDESSQSSEESTSMPPLQNRGNPNVEVMTRLQGGRQSERRRDTTNNDDEQQQTATNPLTHLRDYGALRVFATATCPICLEEHNPVVALKCGHIVCEADYEQLGGYLASDKEKYETKCNDGPSPEGATRGAEGADALAPALDDSRIGEREWISI